jgi:putative pyruvate formate lyase activating enzyme
VGDLVVDENGIARRGLLVRHLVLPADLADTERVLEFLAHEVSPRTHVNLMGQYRPCYRAYDCPPLDRPITAEEFRAALAVARRLGLPPVDGGEGELRRWT